MTASMVKKMLFGQFPGRFRQSAGRGRPSHLVARASPPAVSTNQLVHALHYSEKINEAITIPRAIRAPRTTSRLNLRIRLSYACTQSIRPEPAADRFVTAADRLFLTLLVLTGRVMQRQRRKLP